MLFLFIVEALLLVSLVSLLFFLVSFKEAGDSEGVTSYECGFDLNCSTRVVFSYRFFLISVLFLIFDVEITLMLPVPFFSYEGSLFLWFLLILVVGLLFEYFLGALDWV